MDFNRNKKKLCHPFCHIFTITIFAFDDGSKELFVTFGLSTTKLWILKRDFIQYETFTREEDQKKISSIEKEIRIRP